jgi:predicted house-cleaning NTP pyrophosphatase (Maf/HAM1 superfamily)
MMAKAGAYAIQEHGKGIVYGSYHNVMILPTERLADTLERIGMVRRAS